MKADRDVAADRDDETAAGVPDRDPTQPLDGGPVPAPPAEPAGWPAPPGWERFRPLEVLGSGGMGVVFKAWEAALQRHVALKFLGGVSEEGRRRFLREAQLQARVDHPGVCKVFEVGEVAGHPYIAMQLIAGRPLDRLARELSLEQRALVVAEVAEAVHAAHRSGLIHRDLKPANIMVERAEDGRLRPYVVDFGLVRDLAGDGLTVDGRMLGTPAYMSPEQARGDPARVDRRADVYGLGATLYAVLAGRPPFAAPTALALVRRVLDEDPEPVRRVDRGVPAELESIVMKCLEKEPERRYDSARALAEDLHRFLDGVPVRARPGGLAYRVAKWVRRNRALAAVVLLATVAVAGFGGAALQARWTAVRQAAVAQRLGADVKEIESLMRFAHLLPRHDTGPERRLVRARVSALEARLPELGRAGQGPALAALGRAALAAGDLPAGRAHLEQAWARGYREPEVAYALGLALARLFEREAQAAERIASREARELRRQEIDRTLREPARRLLSASRGAALDAPEYLEAVLARLDGSYPQALERAAAAAARLPWLYEATALAGDVHVALARAAADAGRPDEAAAELARAAAAYEQASRVGASDGDVLSALAECRYERLKLEESRGGQPPELFTATLEAAEAALAASPHSPRPYLVQALAHVARAGFLASHSGQDPTPLFERAAALADAALERSPGDGEAYRVEGAAFADLATYLTEHGRDPLEALDRAISALERALQANPRAVSVLNHLGISYWNLGAHQDLVGLDPLAAYRRAEESFRTALEVHPGFFAAAGNLGGLQQSIASVLEERGEDPRPVLRESIATYEKVIALRPGHPLPHSNLCGAHLALGRWGLTHGGDPGEAFEAAIAACRKAHAADPGYVLAYENMGNALLWRAVLGMARGEDARGGIEDGVAEHEAGLRIRPSHPGPLGDALVTLAANEVAQGRDPRPAVSRAARVLDEAARSSPHDASPLLSRARLGIVAARASVARGASPLPHLVAAREAVERAVALGGPGPEASALLAETWLAQAEAAGSPGDRARSVAAGLEQLAARPPRRNAEVRAAEAALRVVGGGPDARAACVALVTALAENPTLRPDYRTVTARCR